MAKINCFGTFGTQLAHRVRLLPHAVPHSSVFHTSELQTPLRHTVAESTQHGLCLVLVPDSLSAICAGDLCQCGPV